MALIECGKHQYSAMSHLCGNSSIFDRPILNAREDS